jgi:hypothetical protein
VRRQQEYGSVRFRGQDVVSEHRTVLPMPYRLITSLAGALLLGSAAQAQSLSQMEPQAATVAERYLAVWSESGDASIAGVPYVYGPTVTFYGRTLTQRGLIEEKRRAVRRWPVRHYEHRPGTMRVICNEAARRCAARSIIDYAVSNPSTGKRARGSATFDLGISFAGPRPVILYETGGPLRGRRGA